MRTHDQFDIETLFERLQPVEDQAGANVRLVGGKRLDQGLAAGALVQIDVDVLAGVEPFREAKREWRVAGGNFSPGEPDFWRRPSQRERRTIGRGSASHPDRARGSRGPEHCPPRNTTLRRAISILLSHRVGPLF
jgi:hypothetical protein